MWYTLHMVAAIRQTVTIREDGRVEIRAPELRSGAVAEVIVLMPQEPPAETPAALETLDRLQKSLRLDRNAAESWIRQVNEERRAM